jgi:hypothetical protein
MSGVCILSPSGLCDEREKHCANLKPKTLHDLLPKKAMANCTYALTPIYSHGQASTSLVYCDATPAVCGYARHVSVKRCFPLSSCPMFPSLRGSNIPTGMAVNLDFQVTNLLGLDSAVTRTQIRSFFVLVVDAAGRVGGDSAFFR